MGPARPRLGSILVRQGAITQQELEAAVLYQIRAESSEGRTLLADASGAGRSGPRSPKLGEALIALGICTEAQISRALAEQMEIPFIDLDQEPPAVEALALMPASLARMHRVLPARVNSETIVLAVGGPLPSPLLEALERTLSMKVELACAPESEIGERLEKYEQLLERVAPAGSAVAQAAERSGSEAEEACPVTTVNELVAEATRQGATDVCFEPLEDRVRVHYRIGGRLKTAATLQRSLMRGVIAHIKLMCGMELTERPRPQDGRCHMRVDGRGVDLHASTLPGAYGESAVLRVVG